MSMKLGLHNYSYYLHGLGGRWQGFRPPWPQQMDVFDLLDRVVELGLQGVHLDAAAIGPTTPSHLGSVKGAVAEKGLYIEFNWGLPKQGADQRLQFDLPSGIDIAHQLGADVGKLSLNLNRPRPVMASRHCPEVMAQLERIAVMIADALPLLDRYQIKLAIENHTDCFASEIIWLLDTIGHPLVGACVDTVNPMMVGEDPLQAIRDLAPFAFTNHFRDSVIQQTRYGCRIVGCALGDGDLDLVSAYRLLAESSAHDRINIEVALAASTGDKDTALNMENVAIQKSIAYCRDQLQIR